MSSPPRITFTAQYLNSGILPKGSSHGIRQQVGSSLVKAERNEDGTVRRAIVRPCIQRNDAST